jgi:hypothetical protein
MQIDTNAIARIREAAERDATVRLARVSAPVDVTDAEAFPNIAAARAHLASMSPESRAELEREWGA